MKISSFSENMVHTHTLRYGCRSIASDNESDAPLLFELVFALLLILNSCYRNIDPLSFLLYIHPYMYAQRSSVADVGLPKKRSTEVMIESLHGFHVLIGLPTIITPPLPRFCCVPPFAFARRPSQQPLAFTRLEWFLHEKRNLLLLQLCYHMGCRILQGPKSGICVENWPN